MNTISLTLQAVGTDGVTRWYVGFCSQEFLNRIRFTTKEDVYPVVNEWCSSVYQAENELDAEQQSTFDIRYAQADVAAPVKFEVVRQLLSWHYPDSR